MDLSKLYRYKVSYFINCILHIYKVLKLRLVIGLVCIAISILMLLSGEVSESPAPAIVVLIIGLSAIATSRLKKI